MKNNKFDPQYFLYHSFIAKVVKEYNIEYIAMPIKTNNADIDNIILVSTDKVYIPDIKDLLKYYYCNNDKTYDMQFLSLRSISISGESGKTVNLFLKQLLKAIFVYMMANHKYNFVIYQNEDAEITDTLLADYRFSYSTKNIDYTFKNVNSAYEFMNDIVTDYITEAKRTAAFISNEQTSETSS